METRAHNSRRYESISKVSTGFVREIEELDKALERQGYSVEISLYDAGLAEFWMNDGECQIVIRSRDDAERYEIIAWHFPKNSRYDHTHHGPYLHGPYDLFIGKTSGDKLCEIVLKLSKPAKESRRVRRERY